MSPIAFIDSAAVNGVKYCSKPLALVNKNAKTQDLCQGFVRPRLRPTVTQVHREMEIQVGHPGPFHLKSQPVSLKSQTEGIIPCCTLVQRRYSNPDMLALISRSTAKLASFALAAPSYFPGKTGGLPIALHSILHDVNHLYLYPVPLKSTLNGGAVCAKFALKRKAR